MPTNTQFERSRRTPSVPRWGSGQRGLSANHAVRLGFRIDQNTGCLPAWFAARCWSFRSCAQRRPAWEPEDQTAQPAPVNLQVSTEPRAGSHRLRQGHVHLPCSVGKRRFCEACPGSPGKYRAKCGRHGLQGGPRPAHLPHTGGAAQEIGADSEAMIKDPAAFLNGSRIAASTPSPASLSARTTCWRRRTRSGR